MDGIEVTYRKGWSIWIPAEPWDREATAAEMKNEPGVVKVTIHENGTIREVV